MFTWFKKSYYFLLMIAMSSPLKADYTDQFADAISAYDAGNFAESSKIFKSLNTKHPNQTNILFNLGNSLYRQNLHADALTSYLNARSISPRSHDIQSNIDIVSQKLQVSPPNHVLYDSKKAALAFPLIKFLNIFDLFSIAILSSLIFTLLTWAKLYRSDFIHNGWLKWIGTTTAISIALGVCSIQIRPDWAVISQEKAYVKSSPNQNSTDLYELTLGSAVQIKDTHDSWHLVQIDHLKSGWLPESSLSSLTKQS